VSPNTEPVAARIEAESKSKLEEAAEECGLNSSAYLRTVIQKHIDENPNDLRALESAAIDEPCETKQSLQGKSAGEFVEGMLGDME